MRETTKRMIRNITFLLGIMASIVMIITNFGGLCPVEGYATAPTRYTIKFKDYDGTTLQSERLTYGATPSYTGNTPTKAPTADTTFIFSGWDPAIHPVTQDQIYVATYTGTPRKYVISFVDEAGTLLDSQELEYRTIPSIVDPVKAETTDFKYQFAGWTPAITWVTRDTTYTAQFIEIRKNNTMPAAPAQSAGKTKSENKEEPHVHSFTWEVTKSPTSTTDGEEVHICSCGAIDDRNILQAISAFEEETINKIKNAPANGVVSVDTKLFNSFGIGVRDALAAKPDVTLKVSFLSEGYKGERLKVTIPAGTDVKTLWDDKGWLGLCRAGSTLGYDNTQQ